MLSLSEKPLQFIQIDGKAYEVKLSFDNVLRFFDMMDDDELSQQDKWLLAFSIFFKKPQEVPQDALIESVDSLIKYLVKSPYGQNTGSDEQSGTPIKYFSYTQDAEAIYASFMQAYHIDLIEEQGRLHWDQFKALLNGLPANTCFQRIVSIRQKTTEGMENDPKALAQLVEAQSYYALDSEVNAQAQDDALAAFANSLF
ncbi:Gp15 family bacteriophage protein [Ligilactobacillus equi]|uniref:Bacteriophage Gp15 protein n=1 Tax=Ligilactobacillus equi DPC 6820 TaxID=1392007 RepID=V7I1D6_9LACO|nr:Gp15 family bacteriophage protein [Ligilactobacillus equi]ETA75096.1 bacteriophage Gp15 protein [Ligilactobacillus equi DPC 6820]